MAAKDVILTGILVFIFAMGFFVVFFVSNQVTTKMMGIAAINESQAAVDALQGSQAVSQKMDYVVFGVFIGLILALIITSWYIGANPIFMFIYFLVIVLGVTFSTVLSNVWETVTQSSIFGTTVNYFPLSNNILTNLPLYTAVIGFLGLVVMFAKPYFTGGGGGQTY